MNRRLPTFGFLIVLVVAFARGQIVSASTSVNLSTNGVVYDSATGNLYATVPSGSSSVSDSLVPLNPYSGAVARQSVSAHNLAPWRSLAMARMSTP